VHLEGLREVATYLAGALTTFRFRLILQHVHDLVDPDVLIAEYTSEGEVTTNGNPYANVYIGVWRFRDGRVCGTKEFYNPLIAQRALGDG
jgi:ketosteroid isomerase-like protein